MSLTDKFFGPRRDDNDVKLVTRLIADDATLTDDEYQRAQQVYETLPYSVTSQIQREVQ